jgi:hypothetical protein
LLRIPSSRIPSVRESSEGALRRKKIKSIISTKRERITHHGDLHESQPNRRPTDLPQRHIETLRVDEEHVALDLPALGAHRLSLPVREPAHGGARRRVRVGGRRQRGVVLREQGGGGEHEEDRGAGHAQSLAHRFDERGALVGGGGGRGEWEVGKGRFGEAGEEHVEGGGGVVGEEADQVRVLEGVGIAWAEVVYESWVVIGCRTLNGSFFWRIGGLDLRSGEESK